MRETKDSRKERENFNYDRTVDHSGDPQENFNKDSCGKVFETQVLTKTLSITKALRVQCTRKACHVPGTCTLLCSTSTRYMYSTSSR